MHRAQCGQCRVGDVARTMTSTGEDRVGDRDKEVQCSSLTKRRMIQCWIFGRCPHGKVLIN